MLRLLERGDALVAGGEGRVVVAALVGAGIGVFGIVQHMTWNGRLYWVGPEAPASSFGPFVNRTHSPGPVELGLPRDGPGVALGAEGAAGDPGRHGAEAPGGRDALAAELS